MKYLTILFGCYLFFSCQVKTTTCGTTRKEFLSLEKSKVFSVENGNASFEFKDKGKDSIEGGYYTFYRNGQLKEYVFLKNLNTSIYTEQYDSLGHLIHQEGNPLIHKSTELINDSLSIKFYFLTLKKNYRKIDLVTAGDKITTLSLSLDSLFSNTQVANYAIKGLSKESDIDAYINVEYQNECTGEIRKFKDSINLHYKPRVQNPAQ